MCVFVWARAPVCVCDGGVCVSGSAESLRTVGIYCTSQILVVKSHEYIDPIILIQNVAVPHISKV
jgi:hypothetical protein